MFIGAVLFGIKFRTERYTTHLCQNTLLYQTSYTNLHVLVFLHVAVSYVELAVH